MDDLERLDGYRRMLRAPTPPAVLHPMSRDARLARMLVGSVCGGAAPRDATLEEGLRLLWEHPQVRAELIELFDVLEGRVDHRHRTLARHPDAPLQVHARYTRIEILAAFHPAATTWVPRWQTGVYFAPEERADLLAFTLDKTSGQFSPTTRYRDHAISPTLIHWESQSMTREESETGLRYRHHERDGSSVMLFCRLRQTDRAFWFLGPATYVHHEGERPMAITWRLLHALPGDLFQSFAAAVA
jgi:hypothetical protein